MLKSNSLIEFTQNYDNLAIRAFDTTSTHNFYSTTFKFPNVAMFKNKHIIPYVLIHELETIPLAYCLPHALYTVGVGVNGSTIYYTLRDGKLAIRIPKILQSTGLLAISRVSCKIVLENPRDWANPETQEFFDFRVSDFPMPDEYINKLLYPEQYAEAPQPVEQE